MKAHLGWVVILGAASGGCYFDQPGSPGYGVPDPYYDYYETELDVEVEALAGSVGGRTFGMEGGAVAPTGRQSGSSAYFALTVAEDGSTADYDDVSVNLDICPIEEYAGGGPIDSPESGFLNFYVCDNATGVCLDTWSGDLDIEVNDTAEGRLVTANGTWSSGDRVAMTLRYTPPE